MNNVYLKNDKKSDKIIKIYLFSLVIVILYGLYKNILDNNGANILELVTPLIILFVPLIFIFIYNFLKLKKFVIEYEDLPWLFISLFLPINFNFFVYLILFIIMFILSKKWSFNFDITLLFYLTLIFISHILGDLSFINYFEGVYSFNYSFFDIFIGRSVSGVFSSSMLCSIGCYLILLFNVYYKRVIALLSIITYAFFIFIFSFFIDINFANASAIFLLFVLNGSFSLYTPIGLRKEIIYSIILGVLSFLCALSFNYYVAVFISLFVLQLSGILLKKFLNISFFS